MTTAELVQRLQNTIANKGAQFRQKTPWTFTLERAHGQTYSRHNPVLYGHNTYPKGSVLAGQPQRVYINEWESWDDARATMAEVQKALPDLQYDDLGPEGGSSHVDVDVLTAHLPDGPDV